MKINFLFNVPAEHSSTNSTSIFLNVHAEVLGVNTPNETCFLQSIACNGVTMLWDLKTSQQLFDLVSNHACALANEELKRQMNAVTLTEQYYQTSIN